jgi:putative transposase
MATRGISLSYETVRRWTLKVGQQYANELRRRRPQPGDKWHLDEVFLTIQGKTASLWRAVDQQGTVLDILVQSRRNKAAAAPWAKNFLVQGQPSR